MRKIMIPSVLILLFAVPAAASPTVVELYQSQGCSSCPPAIANINALADDPRLLVLDFAVTYWDGLGWKDTFAKSAFTQRQRDYSHGLGNGNVYTPQVVVAGRHDLVGADGRELRRAVDAAGKTSEPPNISMNDKLVSIGDGHAVREADVWLVRYDPRTNNVAIGAGENGGLTLAHRNIVREIIRLGGWSGKTAAFVLPPAPDSRWRDAILVQATSGGEILAAFKS